MKYYFKSGRKKTSPLGFIKLSPNQELLTLNVRAYGNRGSKSSTNTTKKRRESMKELYETIKNIIEDYYKSN